MNWYYSVLLNALLDAISQEELLTLAQDHPELLSEEFQDYVRLLISEIYPIDPYVALTTELEFHNRFQILEHALQATALVAHTTARILDIPDHIPPSNDPRAAWVKPFREYIAVGFNSNAYLQKALDLAQQVGEREIASLLFQLVQGEVEAAAEQVQHLFAPLHQQGRLEEAYSMLLLPIAMQTTLVEQFRQYLPEQQAAVLQAGLLACEVGYQLSRALSDEPCQAKFLTVEGLGLYASWKLETAVMTHEEALEIYRRLAQKHPERYEPDVAMTLNNLGHTLDRLRRYEDALTAHKEALEIYRRLAQKHPERYEPDVAMTLNNLGHTLDRLRRYKDALAAYEEALEIYRRLAQKHPERYEPDVAMTLNSKGVALHSSRRFVAIVRRDEQALTAFKDVIAAYEEALEIYRRLAQKHPERYEPDVAMVLNNLGNALSAVHRYEDALTAYEEALEIHRRLAQKHPERYEPDVAMTLNSLGNALSAAHRYEDALTAYEEALEIYRRLAQKHPEQYRLEMEWTLGNLGDASRDLRILAQQQPEQYEPYLARALILLGTAYSDLRKFEGAVAAYEEALGLYQILAQWQPEIYAPAVARTLADLENALSMLRRFGRWL